MFSLSSESTLTVMVRCTNKGCGQEFDPENNPEGSCTFHPGAPVSTVYIAMDVY